MMNLIDILKEIMLGMCIAVIMPFIVSWGVKTFYPDNNTQVSLSHNIDAKLKTEETQLESKQKNENQIIFWAYFLVSILTIFAGSFANINSLSLGLIGGGFLNLLAALINSPNIPMLNFVIFLFMFFALIFIITLRQKRETKKRDKKFF